VRRSLAVVVAACVLALGTAAGAASPHDLDQGRHHLKKANALANEGRCDAAVREYTQAYQKLHDPVVLFNRAECYRRMGQNAAAADDYRAFLEAVPHAPNRVEVEARLAVMEGLPPPAPGAPPPRPAAPPPRSTAPPPVRAAAPPPIAQPPQAAAPPPPAAISPLPPMPPPLPEPSVPPPAAPAPAPEAPAVVAVREAPAPAQPAVESEGHGRLWIWVAVGALVAGGAAAGAYFALRTPSAPVPMTQLGNYNF